MFRKSLCLLLLCFLAGCLPQIKSGTVIKKEYFESYTTEETVQISSFTVNDVEFPVYGTETVFHPARWVITIENEIQGRVVSRKIDVEQSVYDKTQLKEWFEL